MGSRRALARPSATAVNTMLLVAAVLALGLLPSPVLPCGHHVVSGSLRSLVALHTAHQAAHPASGAWGSAGELRLGGGEGRGEEEEDGDDEVHHYAQDHAAHHHHDGHEHHDHVGHAGHHVEHHEQEQEHGHAHDHKEHGEHGHGHGEEEEEGDVVEARRRLQQSTAPPPAPLRLSVSYQQLDALDAGQQQTLTRVVEAVRRILQKFISVRRPPSGGLLADPYCLSYSRTRGCLSYYPDFRSAAPDPEYTMCGLAVVRPEHVVNPANCSRRSTITELEALGKGTAGAASGAGSGASGYGAGCSSYAGTQGEATDMYMYITAVQNSDCADGAAAWARPCLLDLGNNRPLLGAANICPPALGMLDEASLTAVLAHEMLHALGFTESMFNLTRRADGSPRPEAEVVARTVIDGRTISRLITPGVRDAARAHFGCPTLPGAQLEEEGSEGSAGSHWEYNLFQGEVMVASTIFAADGSPPALSNLTLSYLEDTGWYAANRSAAGLLAWGAGAGCSLPSSSCKQYMAAVPEQRLFCDPTAATSSSGSPSFRCSSDYKSTGVCRSLNFTSGCGLLLSHNAEQTCTGSSASNDMPDVFGWGSGTPAGRCLPVVYLFQAALGSTVYTFPASGRDGDADAACFDTSCSADGNTVYVKLLGQSFECPAGQYLNLASLLPGRYLSGHIGPCPSPASLCSTQSCPAAACNPAGGDCLNGQCYCRLAFTGPSCSYNLITGQALPNDAAGGSNTGTGGNSTSGGASPVPAPVAVWTQVVQLSLSLYNQPADMTARAAALTAALASWAELAPSAVRLALVAAATNTGAGAAANATTDGPQLSAGEGSNGGASAATQAGQAYDATTASPTPSPTRRRRDLLQAGTNATAASPSPRSPSPTPPPPSPRPPSPAPPAPAATITALLTMSSSRATTILVGRLRDGTQLSQLHSVLAAAGFTTQPASLAFQTLITKVTASSPPPPLPRAGAGAAAAAAAAADADSGSSRMVIIIAIAAGGVAVAGIVVAIVVVTVVRRRRAKRAAAQLQQYAYTAAAATAAANGSPGSGYTYAGAPPPKRAARYQMEEAAGYSPPPAAAVATGGFSALPVSTGTGLPVTVNAYPSPAPQSGPWGNGGGGGVAAPVAGGGAPVYDYYNARAAALWQGSPQQQQQQAAPFGGQQPPAGAGGYGVYR